MINSIQYLRALAAWMVVLHHFVQLYFGSAASNWIARFFLNYGAYGVDLFFIISGFVIYHSTSGKTVHFKQFIVQRLARLAPAYWFYTLLITTLVVNYKNLIPLTAFEPVFLLKSLLFLPAKNPSGIGFFPLLTIGWTLNYEMVFYLMFALSLFFPFKFRLLTTTVGLLLLILVTPKIGHDFLFYSNKIIFEFLLGMGIYSLWKRGWIQKTHYSMAIIFIIGALLLFSFEPPIGHHYLRSGVPCAFIFTAVLSLNHRLNSSWIINLGNWSYSTYLCHLLILALLRPISMSLHLPNFFIICLIFPLILVLSYISYTFIEKPVQNYVKSFRKQKETTSTSEGLASL
ncbi:acyltransferase family protein [Legionella jamestowniensis]|uniref:Acyltransferase n=1 Tax=Legionella jamestowniensis TaxID=455 RepID=A0A0W0UFW6_9GAMM|nr:acyltransferase [Legionella jamestowniensis]KTD06802.1 acyltransferase [Legionella jamestowniensis]SFL83035.1 Peptidoglycan/LPS O-acetylase OafA/YrhL, contains acyltransferase and SGNH-hydrolase domains [Legionella jamestowniensis DSM 19215]